jgi:hypothetical protein
VEVLIEEKGVNIGRFYLTPDDPEFRFLVQEGAIYGIWQIKKKAVVQPPGNPNMFTHFRIPLVVRTTMGGQVIVDGVSQASPYAFIEAFNSRFRQECLNQH